MPQYGSNKDMEIHGGLMTFEFSDRFSLFDYGSFPFTIPGKGEGQRKMAVAIDQKIKKKFHSAFVNYNPLTQTYFSPEQFIPLEIIFRLGVTPGSSYLKRHPEVKPYTLFKNPLIEITTKLEEKDRLLTYDEAAALSPLPIRTLIYEVAPFLARMLQQIFADKGLELWDGKFEFAYLKGEYILIDAITQDELRFSQNNLECSKELLRRPYRTSSWYKNGMQGTPPTLTEEFQKLIGEIYLHSGSLMEEDAMKSATLLAEKLKSYEEEVCRAF